MTDYKPGGPVTTMSVSTFNPATHKAVPLDAVVLDLDEIGWPVASFTKWLREMATYYRFIHGPGNPEKLTDLADQIEAQTRPAIEEPTGLGAVVEDERGTRWVRVGGGAGFPWRKSADEFVKASWDSVRPVRIISEGVQP